MRKQGRGKRGEGRALKECREMFAVKISTHAGDPDANFASGGNYSPCALFFTRKAALMFALELAAHLKGFRMNVVKVRFSVQEIKRKATNAHRM